MSFLDLCWSNTWFVETVGWIGPVTVLSYAVIKSTYGETRVLCLSLVPSKVIAFFYGLSRELRDISALLGCIDLIAFNIFDVSDATYTPGTYFSTVR